MKIDPISAEYIADHLNGRLEGDRSQIIDNISEINDASPNSLCFLANPKYEKFVYSTERLTILVDKDFSLKSPTKNSLIYVDNVYAKFSSFLKIMHQNDDSGEPIKKTAIVNDDVFLGKNVRVGHCSIIKSKVKIGANSIIMDQVYIGESVKIGENVKIYPGVKIMRDSIIGSNVIIQSNAVIGSDGFGFSYGDGHYDKIPQIGNVVIGDWVEIGSSTTIDRATIGSTIIKKGVKLDNLIQVGHNVVINENTVIAAQSGIAGSSEIGLGSRIGGQVGIAGHLKIAPYSQIQAKSGIASSITESGKKWYGYPIIGYTEYLKSYAVFKRLPQLLKRLTQLEKKSDWNDKS